MTTRRWVDRQEAKAITNTDIMMVITGVVADAVVADVETTTGTVMVAIIVMVEAEVAVIAVIAVIVVIVVAGKDSTLELLYPRPSMTMNGERNRTICKFV